MEVSVLKRRPRNARGNVVTRSKRRSSGNATARLAGVVASLTFVHGVAAHSLPITAHNVVPVRGLFADGSCWSDVIARLQAAGLNTPPCKTR
jgi:hypothetical protein